MRELILRGLRAAARMIQAGLDWFGRLVASGIRRLDERLSARQEVPSAEATAAAGVTGSVVTATAGRAYVASKGWSGFGAVGRQLINGRSVAVGAGVPAMAFITWVGLIFGFLLGTTLLANVWETWLHGARKTDDRNGFGTGPVIVALL